MKRVMMIALMLGIIAMWGVGQQTKTPAAAPLKMVTRSYDVLPPVGERICALSPDQSIALGSDVTTERETEWKQFFQDLGVQWPEGSSLKYLQNIHKIVLVNTEENLQIFENILVDLNVVPSQIEIESQFVEYKRSDIDALAKKGMVNAGSLIELWQKGQAELLGAPKVVTQSGQEATVKGVVEYIYPTELDAEAGIAFEGLTNVNLSVTNGCLAVTPGGFETREVGVIFKVTPEVSSEGNMINLTMSPEYVREPTWKRYPGKIVDGSGKEVAVEIEEPFFRTQSVVTSISIKNGAKILVGGGMPNGTNDKLVYMFVMARLIDIEGKPLKPREDLLEKATKHPAQ